MSAASAPETDRHQPYTREMFERTHRWMESWELFDSTGGRTARLRGRSPDLSRIQRPRSP